jgi:hypothetical protein
MRIIPLYDDVYAVKFPYAMVTERTVSMALPHDFRREVGQKQMTIKFAAETESEAGTKRANCAQIQKVFPAELAILRSQVDEAELKQFIIIKVQ